jgi:hypothetical protein
VKNVEEIFGWATAGGLGIFFAGLGVLFWGLHYQTSQKWKGWKDKDKE